MVDILSVSCQTPSNQFDITQSFLFIVAHKISRIICYENSFFPIFSLRITRFHVNCWKQWKKTMLKAGEDDFHSSSDST